MAARYRFALILSVLALGFTNSRGLAADDCEAILRHGIVDQTKIDSDVSLKTSVNEFLYDMDFQTHDEAIHAGLSVGMIVYGVPLQMGGEFTQQQKNLWRHQHAEYRNNSLSTAAKRSVFISKISTEVVHAWEKCIAEHARSFVFGAYLKDTQQPDRATLVIAWNPIHGDNGGDPAVTTSEIAGGTRRPDGKPIAFDPGQKLKQGGEASQVIIDRVHGQALTVVVHTSRGDLSADLAPIIDKPAITEFSVPKESVRRGKPVTLKWATKDATTVTIDNGVGKVPDNGSRDVKPTSSVDYTLTAANEGGEVTKLAHVEVIQPPKLKSLIIIYHTTKDKDDDTGIVVSIVKEGKELARYSQDQNHKDKYPNNSDLSRVLTLTPGVTVDDIDSATMTITIDPIRHDEWSFVWSMVAELDDGGKYVAPGGSATLTHDSKSVSVALPPQK